MYGEASQYQAGRDLCAPGRSSQCTGYQERGEEKRQYDAQPGGPNGKVAAHQCPTDDSSRDRRPGLTRNGPDQKGHARQQVVGRTDTGSCNK